jgi:SNF2 family DNA or RNA helicase
MSYKFITKNSIEEKILKLQEKKQQLANDIIAMNENWFSQLDLADMESLLS